ncbi:MAG: hypothetical protein CM15mP91_0940 [Chloroflexota bacterium]|nr:MAG: hypothetical protein CM15mP91_0940 [Chloroflexota bacterium]
MKNCRYHGRTCRESYKAGKVLGSTFFDTKICEKWIKNGYNFMNIADPLSLGQIN